MNTDITNITDENRPRAVNKGPELRVEVLDSDDFTLAPSRVVPISDPAPARKGRPRGPSLRTLDQLEREQERLYRAARNGDIATTDASRLSYQLGELRKTKEVTQLLRRVKALEGSRAAIPLLGTPDDELTLEDRDE